MYKFFYIRNLKFINIKAFVILILQTVIVSCQAKPKYIFKLLNLYLSLTKNIKQKISYHNFLDKNPKTKILIFKHIFLSTLQLVIMGTGQYARRHFRTKGHFARGVTFAQRDKGSFMHEIKRMKKKNENKLPTEGSKG